MGPLPSNRQSAAVTQATITTDIHQPFDIELDVFTEFTLDTAFFLYQISKPSSLIFGEFLDLLVDSHIGLLTEASRSRTPYSVNIGERNFHPLIVRYVDTCHTH